MKKVSSIVRMIRDLKLKLSKQEGCERCRRSWANATGHVTKLGNNRGMYPLCESCWSELTVEARLPFYKQLLRKWRGLDDPDDPIPSWDFVRKLVYSEGESEVKLQSKTKSSAQLSNDELAWKM